MHFETWEKRVPWTIVLAICAGLTVSASASAAPRMVLAEEWTATWCGYCPNAGMALGQMLSTYPETFTLVQHHYEDGYQTSWSNDRREDFYPGFGGVPWAWFDGVIKKAGGGETPAAVFARYNSAYADRQAVATDVAIVLTGDLAGGQTFSIGASVCLEAGGTAKTVRLYIVQVLDHWPTEVSYSRNGFKQAAATADLTLNPGECQTVVRNFTFDADSWANQSNIRIVAWVQEPLAAGPAEVYQAKAMSWPFPAGADCNDNGVPDLVEISQGT
ncbi:MAG: hypothetical protein JXB13_09410, partial [Phycisphaerae bacterium]|nr:hypothetical protein [Phycisphaerae bacterium]